MTASPDPTSGLAVRVADRPTLPTGRHSMATDETRRPRPDPTAPDPVPGPGRTNGERPTGRGRRPPRAQLQPWALNESRSGGRPGPGIECRECG